MKTIQSAQPSSDPLAVLTERLSAATGSPLTNRTSKQAAWPNSTRKEPKRIQIFVAVIFRWVVRAIGRKCHKRISPGPPGWLPKRSSRPRASSWSRILSRARAPSAAHRSSSPSGPVLHPEAAGDQRPWCRRFHLATTSTPYWPSSRSTAREESSLSVSCCSSHSVRDADRTWSSRFEIGKILVPGDPCHATITGHRSAGFGFCSFLRRYPNFH